MAYEYLLSTNSFNKPEVMSGKDAIAIKLLTLLTMKPGTDPLHPEMGIDIVGRYRYSEEDDLSDLQDEINTQLSVYLPYYNTVSVTVSYDDGMINTSINIDDTLYSFSSDSEGAAISTDQFKGQSNPNATDDSDDYDNEDYTNPYDDIPSIDIDGVGESE